MPSRGFSKDSLSYRGRVTLIGACGIRGFLGTTKMIVKSESQEALAYFVCCHSMRDWLINDGATGESKLIDQLKQYPEWKVVHDLANRTRHLTLNQRLTDKEWSIARYGNVIKSGTSYIAQKERCGECDF